VKFSVNGEDVQVKVRSWAAPFLLGLVGLLLATVGSMGLVMWNNQQDVLRQANGRITTLELALATITENQRVGAADRTTFQDATTKRLDQMGDVLVSMRENLAALTAIQKQRDTEP
jgi:hypothetical protein